MDDYRENCADTKEQGERKRGKQLSSNNMSALGMEAPNWNGMVTNENNGFLWNEKLLSEE